MAPFFYLFPLLFSLLLSGCVDQAPEETKFYGNVDVRTVSFAFRVSGRIETIRFDEGEKIKKGEIIATLDDALYQESLKAIEAQITKQKAVVAKLEKGYRVEEIAKAKAKLLQSEVEKEKLRKDFKRVNDLYKSKAVSTQEYDNAKAAYEIAEASYSYAKNTFLLLQNGSKKRISSPLKRHYKPLSHKRISTLSHLSDTLLKSPTDGTILTRMYEEGSIVSPTQNVVEIAKDDAYWVRSYLSEKKYLGIVKVAQKALIHTDNGKTVQNQT